MGKMTKAATRVLLAAGLTVGVVAATATSASAASSYVIRNSAATAGYCLGVHSSSTSSGAAAVVGGCTFDTSQQ